MLYKLSQDYPSPASLHHHAQITHDDASYVFVTHSSSYGLSPVRDMPSRCLWHGYRALHSSPWDPSCSPMCLCPMWPDSVDAMRSSLHSLTYHGRSSVTLVSGISLTTIINDTATRLHSRTTYNPSLGVLLPDSSHFSTVSLE
jgi:hypothetical protein